MGAGTHHPERDHSNSILCVFFFVVVVVVVVVCCCCCFLVLLERAVEPPRPPCPSADGMVGSAATQEHNKKHSAGREARGAEDKRMDIPPLRGGARVRAPSVADADVMPVSGRRRDACTPRTQQGIG